MKCFLMSSTLIILAACDAAVETTEPQALVAIPAAEIIRTPTKVALFG